LGRPIILLAALALVSGCAREDGGNTERITSLTRRVSALERAQNTPGSDPSFKFLLVVSWEDSPGTVFQHTYADLAGCNTAKQDFFNQNNILMASIGRRPLASAPHFARVICIPA